MKKACKIIMREREKEAGKKRGKDEGRKQGKAIEEKQYKKRGTEGEEERDGEGAAPVEKKKERKNRWKKGNNIELD